MALARQTRDHAGIRDTLLLAPVTTSGIVPLHEPLCFARRVWSSPEFFGRKLLSGCLPHESIRKNPRQGFSAPSRCTKFNWPISNSISSPPICAGITNDHMFVLDAVPRAPFISSLGPRGLPSSNLIQGKPMPALRLLLVADSLLSTDHG
jgi:hypothetical protein